MKHWLKQRALCIISFWLVLGTIGGQPSAEEQTLEALLNPEITVATVKSVGLRESPGIVTVITSEEIARSGARDLIDILRTVPGFEFGADVLGVTGLGFRGNWAHEGKILLLVDGQEMNELLNSTLQLGNHFSVDQIKQIEIIRGPGSAIYGGNAELAVIQITTRGAEDLNGGRAVLSGGQTAKACARRTVDAAFGQVVSEGFGYSGAVFGGQGMRSDRDYTDFNGESYSLAERSGLNPLTATLKLTLADLSALVMLDRYHTTQQDEFGVNQLQAIPVDFDSLFLDLHYRVRINDRISLTPRLNFKHQQPWKERPAEEAVNTANYDPADIAYDKTAQRAYAELQFNADLSEALNLLAGVKYQADRAWDNLAEDPASSQVHYSGTAGYAQALWQNEVVNVTGGVRYEAHSEYAASFVPRIGLTRVIDPFHFKLLVSKAFRAPSIENVLANADLEPENTTALEVEAGCRVRADMDLVLNLFDTTLDKPIVYSVDPVTAEESYLNFGLVRTRGAEIEYRWRTGWGSLKANYSYYRNIENQVELYQVPERNDLLLGFGAHKLHAGLSLDLLPDLSLTPSATYLSERYGYDSLDSFGVPQARRFEPTLLVNLYARYRNALIQNLDLGLGVFNLLDAPYGYIQPYNGQHAPLPGPSREIVVRAGYRF